MLLPAVLLSFPGAHPGRALPSSPSLKKHSHLGVERNKFFFLFFSFSFFPTVCHHGHTDVSRLHHQTSLYNTKYGKLSNPDKVVVFIRQLRLRNSIKRRPRKRKHPANNDATLQPCVQCVLIATDEAK